MWSEALESHSRKLHVVTKPGGSSRRHLGQPQPQPRMQPTPPCGFIFYCFLHFTCCPGL